MKTIPLKSSGVSTDVGTLAIGTTQINLSVLPTVQKGFMVLDSNSSTLAEVVSYSHNGSNPVTISATTKQHTGGFQWLIDGSVDDYYQEAMHANGWIGIDEAVTCATNNVLTISATGYGAVAEIGDKVWVKDDGTDWYGYVIAKTATSVTILGGGSNGTAAVVAAGSTITSPKFSKASTPLNFPSSFTYALTANTTYIDNGTGGQQPTVNQALYKMEGRKVTAWGRITGKKNGTDMIVNVSLPAAPASSFDYTSVGSTMEIGTSDKTGTSVTLPASSGDQRLRLHFTANLADNSDCVIGFVATYLI